MITTTTKIKNTCVSEGQHIVHIVQRVFSYNLRYTLEEESSMSLEVRRISQVLCSSHIQNLVSKGQNEEQEEAEVKCQPLRLERKKKTH